ncbi:MAG: hypothetical protein KJZ47_07805 [Gemmatimonadales bacterium]|nr:hypothetical protein [Gemmatimonadales bacterium]
MCLDGIAGDFHALWIDPANSQRLYVGDDKGAYASYDGGFGFIMFDNMDLGQFYGVSADNRDPYWVYGGLQDNGNWGGPSNSRDVNGVLNDHWFKFHAGDGFNPKVDPNDWRIVYTESQGGNVRRLDALFRQQGTGITPNRRNVLNLADYLPAGAAAPAPGGPGGGGGFGGGGLPEPQFRNNWSTPFILSPHDSRIIWYGGNHLFKSTDRGDTWRIVSPDLTVAKPEWIATESGGITRDVTGAETHSTIISISESPLIPGMVWVGTDDGNIQLTRDGGATWTNLRPTCAGCPTSPGSAGSTPPTSIPPWHPSAPPATAAAPRRPPSPRPPTTAAPGPRSWPASPRPSRCTWSRRTSGTRASSISAPRPRSTPASTRAPPGTGSARTSRSYRCTTWSSTRARTT